MKKNIIVTLLVMVSLVQLYLFINFSSEYIVIALLAVLQVGGVYFVCKDLWNNFIHRFKEDEFLNYMEFQVK